MRVLTKTTQKTCTVFFTILGIGSIVVSPMDSHPCDRGSSPGQRNHLYVVL